MRFCKKFARKKMARPRLLPIDIYPDHLDEAGRDRVDARVRERQHIIPVVPAPYLDNEGELWTLRVDGTWADKNGISRSSLYTPVLALFGPFTRAEAPSYTEGA